MIRKINEELGAVINSEDLVFIGAITEDFTNHEDLVHVYFGHGVNGTITGCYMVEARHYDI